MKATSHGAQTERRGMAGPVRFFAWRQAHRPLLLFLVGWDKAQRSPTGIFGFCGGMQLISEAYSAKVRPMRKLREGEKDPNPKYRPGLFKEWGFLPVKVVQRDPLFAGLPDEVLVRQAHAEHALAPPSEFVLLASTAECRVQAIKHKERPVYGTQFHPEAYDETHPHGKLILENFFRANGKISESDAGARR